MRILKQNIRVRMTKAFGTPYEQYDSPPQPIQDWLSLLETLGENTTWGGWQAHDPETANRVEKIRVIWNSKHTDLDATAAAAYLGPLHSVDAVQKIMGRNPPAEMLCKAVALVDTVVDYQSLFCSVAYAEDPIADPAKLIKSLEHLLQHLNIDATLGTMLCQE